MKQKVKEFLKVAIINYAVLMTLLITLELSGQLAYKLHVGKYLYEIEPHRDVKLFQSHPYLSVIAKKNAIHTNGGKTVTTNEEGYRITSAESVAKDGDQINVICLGGSTTFGVGVDDEDSWPYILQEQLGDQYRVTNLGIPGYSTMEAMIQLTSTVSELDPDVVVVYQGWNDIRNYHSPNKSADYFWNGAMQQVYLQVKKTKSPLDNFAITYITNRLNERANDIITARTPDQNQGGMIAPTINPSNSGDSLFQVNDPYVDSIYVRNLKMIESICTHLNARSIFIPQVLNLPLYENPEDKITVRTPYKSWTPYIKDTAMPGLIKKFNALMYNNIDSALNTRVVDSILYKYDWETRHFVDEGHFSMEGGKLFTQIVLERIRSFAKKEEF